MDRSQFGRPITFLGQGDSFGEGATETMMNDENNDDNDGSEAYRLYQHQQRHRQQHIQQQQQEQQEQQPKRKTTPHGPQVRNASVIATTECHLLVIDVNTYTNLVTSHGYHLSRVLNTCTILATPPMNRLKSQMNELFKLSKKNLFLKQLSGTIVIM